MWGAGRLFNRGWGRHTGWGEEGVEELGRVIGLVGFGDDSVVDEKNPTIGIVGSVEV